MLVRIVRMFIVCRRQVYEILDVSIDEAACAHNLRAALSTRTRRISVSATIGRRRRCVPIGVG